MVKMSMEEEAPDKVLSEKRKAPDKTETDTFLLEIGAGDSAIEGTPFKKPRMDESTLPPVQVAGLLLNSEAEDMSISQGIFMGEEVEISGERGDGGGGGNPNVESMELSLPVENGSSEKEEEEVVKGDDHDHSYQMKGPVPVPQQEGKRSQEADETDDSDRKQRKGEGDEKRQQERNRERDPGISSSPLGSESEGDKSVPNGEINISVKAFDPVSGKLVFHEPMIKSDYMKLEAFLSVHHLSLTQSSTASGYFGDVESGAGAGTGDDNLFSLPMSMSTSSRKSRWTSSTLGSSIPRESIKTIFTESPTDSPDEDFQESIVGRRGKQEPKLTSTRIGDDSSGPSSKSAKKTGKKTSLSNGETDSSVTGTPKSKTNRKSQDGKSNKKPHEATSAKKKRSAATPKSRTTSREFAGVFSPAINSPAVEVDPEPSPARAVAIVEGTSAKPLTKFEQEVNSEPVNKNALKHSQTLWGAIAPGNPVFARWSDKNYYSGIVKEKGFNDTWIIDFDDATTYPASEGHILPIKILGIGIKGVYCPDTGYHPADAVILGQKFVHDPEIGDTVKYAIELVKGENVGQVLWCTRRMLSLKENYARNLRKEFQPSYTLFKAASVSAENIIADSSRRRTATSLPKSVTTTPVAAKDTTPAVSKTPTTSKPKTPAASKTPKSASTMRPKKVVGGVFDASTIDESSSESKTPKKKVKRAKSKSSVMGEGTSLSSSAKSNRDSSKSGTPEIKKPGSPVKDSPRKSKGKEKAIETRKVFEGYQFFLTASGGGDPTSLGNSSGPMVPYDKDEYRDLIEHKGGEVVDTVGKEDRNKKDKIFLISDNYARTVKYIYCLAACIPCVSHKWVQECILQGKIVPWKQYQLNAGWSIEDSEIIPSHNRRPLEGYGIFITAGSDDLYNYWKPVLTAANAHLLKPKMKKVKGKLVVDDEVPESAQVVVTDATCSPEVMSSAGDRMLPVVKPEWLVQSIICGRKVDFYSHEKYRVTISTTDSEDDDDDDDDPSTA